MAWDGVAYVELWKLRTMALHLLWALGVMGAALIAYSCRYPISSSYFAIALLHSLSLSLSLSPSPFLALLFSPEGAYLPPPSCKSSSL